MNKRIGLVILNYNTFEKTIECIESIKQIQGIKYKIYLVDNKSTNNSVEILKSKYENDENIKILINEKNLGYATGNNVGIRECINDGMDYIGILNNDIILKENSLQYLLEFIESNKKCGAVGPKILSPKGKIEPSCRNRMGYKEKIFGTSILKLIDIFGINKKFHYKSYKFDKPKKVFSLYGCCMIFKRNVLEEVNLLDENTFLYQEEPILFEKINKTNYEVYIEPKAEIVHHHGATTKSDKGFARIEFIKSEKYYCKEYLNLNGLEMLILKCIRFIEYNIRCVYYQSYRKRYKEFINVILK